MSNQRAVALTANYAYANSVITILKSIVAHNTDLEFYLINSDIPQEWFGGLNKYLKNFDCHLTDIKLDPGQLKQSVIYHEHINKMSFGWFVMTQYISSDVVVYLDSDIIVNGSLDPLFNVDFEDHYLWAAAPELWKKDTFNSGVLVANNRRLRQIDGLTEQLFSESTNPNLINGDQEVFNRHFQGQIKSLPLEYNYQIGDDKEAFWRGMTMMQNDLNSVTKPVVIHYVGDDKPANLISAGRLRNIWWHYANASWNDLLVTRYQVAPVVNRLTFGNDILIFTNSANIEVIEDLVRALPSYHFHIAAWTWIAFSLIKLLQYQNVQVYPQVLGVQLHQLIDECQFYLDINHGAKNDDVIQRFAEQGKPILAFDDTADQSNTWSYTEIVPAQNVSQMVTAIKQRSTKE